MQDVQRRVGASLAGCILFGVVSAAVADDGVADIVNFREYSETFASAGQPTEAQLEAVRDAGYDRVVYVAYSDQRNSLEHEDRIVKGLGMEYAHIPVEWEAPTAADFELTAAAIRSNAGGKTLLHCQVNYRASAFSFLYRVLYEDVPVSEAKADMNSVWTPNETWRDLIFEVLEARGVSPDCENCDWSVGE